MKQKTITFLSIFLGFFILAFSLKFAAGAGIPATWDGGVDDISGASKTAIKLTSGHFAWKNPNCKACHGDHHKANHTAPVCASCHGVNGATVLPNGHPQDYPCLNCHKGKHASLGFQSPKDCQFCHKYNWDPNSGQYSNVQDYDVVIIGSGGGGLSAAATLARSGFKVLVLEQNYQTGGCMTAYWRKGYRFEASLHGFNGWDDYEHDQSLDEYWLNLLGIYDKVKMYKADPTIFRLITPTQDVCIPADVDTYHDLMLSLWTSNTEGINTFFENLYSLWSLMDYLMYMFPQVDFTSGVPADKYSGLNLQKLLQFYNTNSLMTNEYLTELFADNDPLKSSLAALSVFLGEKWETLGSTILVGALAGYHLSGYYYPEGGSQSISDAMASVVRDYGGTIKLNTKAVKIIVEDNNGPKVRGVVTNDGCYYRAKYVISNANMPDNLAMLGDALPDGDWKRRAESFKPGGSIINVSIGLNDDIRHLWPEGTHSIFIFGTDSYKKSFEYVDSCDFYNGNFGISNFSNTDPTAAPAGKNVIIICSLMGWDCVNPRWEEGWNTYMNYKNEVADILLQRASDTIGYNLTRSNPKVEVLDVAMPHTVRKFTLAPKGTIFGKGLRADEFQVPASLSNTATPIGNFLMAGSWVFPAGGQSMVMMSGMIAAYSVMVQETAEGTFNNKTPEHRFNDSLHKTRNGMRTFCEASDGDDHFRGDGIEKSLQSCEESPSWCFWCVDKCKSLDYDNLSCKDCHDNANAGARDCEMCHKYETTITDATCLGCHQRQAKDISLGFTDIHSANGNINECKECHIKTDIHGNSKSQYGSMFDKGARETSCTGFGCHFESGLSAENHSVHKGKLDCSACHVKSVGTCYNCHMGTLVETGERKPAAILKDWVFLVNDENGKVRTGNFQSLIYGDETMVVFAPYHSHSVTKADARRCRDCHNNAAIQELFSTGKIIATTWSGGTVTNMKGVIPVVEGKLQFDFIDYDSRSNQWSLMDNVTDHTQYGYCTPLRQDQIEKMKIPQSGNMPEGPVVITEIMYEPTGWDATYEFVEIYNPTNAAVNLSGYRFDNGEVTTIPQGVFIAPGEAIILTETVSTYSGYGYQVYEMKGNLLDDGELLQLKDAGGNIADTVRYDNVEPWPAEPDSGGPSLELKHWSLDNSLAESWKASDVIGGTPGSVPASYMTGSVDTDEIDTDEIDTDEIDTDQINTDKDDQGESFGCGTRAMASAAKNGGSGLSSIIEPIIIMIMPVMMLIMRTIRKRRAKDREK